MNSSPLAQQETCFNKKGGLKMIRMVDISEPIKQLEAASTGEDLRQALLYALEVVESIHNRKFNGGDQNG